MLAVADMQGRIVVTDAMGARITTVTAEAPPLTTLALSGQEDAPIVAYADAEGRVFRVEGGASEQLNADTPIVPGVPPVLAFSRNFKLFAAVESATNGARVLGADGFELEGHGPPTAAAGFADGDFALATLDGSVFRVADGKATLIPLGSGQNGSHSAVRRMWRDAEAGRIHMLRTDGGLWSMPEAGPAGELKRDGRASAFGAWSIQHGVSLRLER